MQITDITPVKSKSNKKIRLAAYARVSTKSEEQIHSFLAQISIPFGVNGKRFCDESNKRG